MQARAVRRALGPPSEALGCLRPICEDHGSSWTSKGTCLYSVYIAMIVDTAVFFVPHIAPKNDPVVGDCVWGKVKSVLKAP